MATLSWEDPHQYERVAWLAPFTGNLGGVLGKGGGAAPVIRPGAFDAMQALQVAYALYGVQQCVTSSTYTGYAYRAQRSSDNATRDFLPNSTALVVAAWAQATGAAQVHLIKWYDQSGNGFDSDTGTIGVAGTSPTLDCSTSVYPIPTFNGTSNRISFASLVAFNTTATGLTFSMSVNMLTVAITTTRALFCTSQASGNTIRAGLAATTTPAFQARTVRADAGSAFGSNPANSTIPIILTGVVDYPNHIVTGYKNNVGVAPVSIGAALPSPNFVNSGGVFIGGMNTDATLFANMQCTVAALYQVVTSANLAALETAMEAAA